MAHRRGAVYYGTLAFGGLFLTGSMGGEVLYYKYFRKQRDEEIQLVSSRHRSSDNSDFLLTMRMCVASVCIGERARRQASEVCQAGDF